MKLSTLASSLVALLSCHGAAGAMPGDIPVTADANYIAIDGWWSQCGNEYFAQSGKSCRGTLEEVPMTPIDLTGSTCYVNIRNMDADIGVEHLIYWFGKTGMDDMGVAVYTWYLPFKDKAQYYPTECTEGGACTCPAAFEALRAGWNTTSTSDSPCAGEEAQPMPADHECRPLGFVPAANFLREHPCPVVESLFKEYQEVDETTGASYAINACTLPARFTSYAPTTTNGEEGESQPKSDSVRMSGALVASAILVMTLSVASM